MSSKALKARSLVEARRYHEQARTLGRGAEAPYH
jgi:hypothetical protein